MLRLHRRQGTVAVLIVCVAIGLPRASGLADTAPDADAIRITYVGNEGFLVAVGDSKVLVDALYRDGVRGYVAIPPARQTQMESARPPFDDISVVLATHSHADHFDAGAVDSYLRRQPKALFVSTNQAGDELKSLVDFPRYADRVRAVVPTPGSRVAVWHSGIRIQVLNLHHGRDRPIENLGFLFEVSGVKMLHIGDTVADAAEFRRNHLHEEKIDFAFIPYWYLAYEGMQDAVREGIQAERIVVMHVPPKGLDESYLDDLGGFESAMSLIRRSFPNAIVFEEEMETQSFAIRIRGEASPEGAR